MWTSVGLVINVKNITIKHKQWDLPNMAADPGPRYARLSNCSFYLYHETETGFGIESETSLYKSITASLSLNRPCLQVDIDECQFSQQSLAFPRKFKHLLIMIYLKYISLCLDRLTYEFINALATNRLRFDCFSLLVTLAAWYDWQWMFRNPCSKVPVHLWVGSTYLSRINFSSTIPLRIKL